MTEEASLQRIPVNDDKLEYSIMEEGKAEPVPRFAIQNLHARECLAEFFGTFVLMAFGLGVINEVNLNDRTRGSWLSINIGWGIGVMFGAHAAGGISGAHLNPAVTIAMAWHGNLPWKKVPGYILAQMVGVFCAAVCIYIMYKPLYDVVDPDRKTSQGFFATYPAAHIPNATAFYTEFFATAILLACIFMLGDQQNSPSSAESSPVHLMFLILGIGAAFGSNSGYALNPARDFGPRLATAICGWGSKVFTLRDSYFWIPIVAPVLGGVVGGYCYKIFIENHHPRK
jgi:MIP family channel proteins